MANISVVVIFIDLLFSCAANSETTANINQSGLNISSYIEGSNTNNTSVVGDSNNYVNIGDTNLNNINSIISNINQNVDNSNKLLNAIYYNSKIVSYSLHVSIILSLALNVYLLVSNRKQIRKLQNIAETGKAENS